MSVKVLEKRIRQGFESEDYYGAEQACQTLYNRLTRAAKNGSAASAEDLDRAFEAVMGAAQQMLEKNQFQAGSALALLAVKHLSEHSVPVTKPDLLRRVESLCTSSYSGISELSKDGALEARKEQLRVVKAALKWSSSPACAGTQHGGPSLNTIAAHVAEKLQDYDASQNFYIRSDAPGDFAIMLDKWVSSTGIAGERDLFLTRAVLMYLVTGNIRDAETLRKSFVKLSGWPVSGRPTDSNPTPPLANFCDVLLKTCQLGARASSLFLRTQSVYQPALSVDPALDTMMQSIGQMYFNIQPPQPSGMAGMMQNMLRGMMGSGGS